MGDLGRGRSGKVHPSNESVMLLVFRRPHFFVHMGLDPGDRGGDPRVEKSNFCEKSDFWAEGWKIATLVSNCCSVLLPHARRIGKRVRGQA
jgi:hypothetical protein